MYRLIGSFLALLAAVGTAASAQSNIDPGERFSWSENAGWIDFRPSHGGVGVTPTHLLGFAWAENVGWIKLGADDGGPYANTGPEDWGVNRAADGALSGFAWSETLGWINFGASHGEAVIDPSSGELSGYAWSENVGWIHLRGSDPPYGVRHLPMPVVIDVSADAAPLADCAELRSMPSEIAVTFNVPLFDPPGDIEDDDVTNPLNYRLVAAGGDRDLQTTDCSALLGDDLNVPIQAVAYDEASSRAALELAGDLPEGPSRFLACGSTSLVDAAGNPLDGNADGILGDDFVLGFRLELQNHFSEGHVDCTLDEWVLASTSLDEILFSQVDVDEAQVSGSASVSNLTASSLFSLGQCVAVTERVSYELGAAVRLEAEPGISIDLLRGCEFFSESGCAGRLLGDETFSGPLFDTADLWEDFLDPLTAPLDASSALCSLSLLTPGGESFDAYVDDLVLLGDGAIFEDGFEVGNVSSWSESVP